MSKPWYCPACSASHDGPVVGATSSGSLFGPCECGKAALAFAERVYRERFGTVPQSMSQVRRLGATNKGKR